MYSKNFITAFIGAIAATKCLAAPSGDRNVLMKRDMCTLVGYSQTSQSIFAGGGRGGPQFGDSSQGFILYFVGGVERANCDDTEDKNCAPVVLDGVTVPGDKLKLPQDITWSPTKDLFNFQGCKVTYEGRDWDGYLDGPLGPEDCVNGVDGTTANSCSYCSVDFECEGIDADGNIVPLPK